MTLSQELLGRLDDLEQKYTAMGQNMQSYLDGLLYADYLTYWNYIHLDTLLSLQNPKTSIPDERIFIMYHQITELYFRLILDAMEQVAIKPPSAELLKRQITRINRYFEQLVNSFDIMIDGMDRGEFLQFRMSLLPASGFQSAQYRMIEIMSTDFWNLTHHSKREQFDSKSKAAKVYQNLYWKSGATELATGKLTLTLQQFEEKYSKTFIELAEKHKTNNLWQCYLRLTPEEQADESLKQVMKEHDFNTNVRWRLSHFRSAVRYLDNKPKTIAATGGTNWQEYLPPKNQRIIFYPSLWAEDELEQWGRTTKF
jgi:tryptophan 2,3-dioxygenase